MAPGLFRYAAWEAGRARGGRRLRRRQCVPTNFSHGRLRLGVTRRLMRFDHHQIGMREACRLALVTWTVASAHWRPAFAQAEMGQSASPTLSPGATRARAMMVMTRDQMVAHL